MSGALMKAVIKIHGLKRVVWQKAKQKHKQRYGTHSELLHTYLAEFMWRQRFGYTL